MPYNQANEYGVIAQFFNNSPLISQRPVFGPRFFTASWWFELGSGADNHLHIFCRSVATQWVCRVEQYHETVLPASSLAEWLYMCWFPRTLYILLFLESIAPERMIRIIEFMTGNALFETYYWYRPPNFRHWYQRRAFVYIVSIVFLRKGTNAPTIPLHDLSQGSDTRD